MKFTRQMVVGLCLVVAAMCAWLAPMDKPAAMQVDAGLNRALTTFATARAVHGVLSVLQGTEFSAKPFGVGISLTPGQVLAPVNEMVKTFTDFMLMAVVAFGVMKLVILIGAYWPISLMLTLAVSGWIWFCFRRERAPLWVSRLIVVMLMVRFAIPVTMLGTDVLWERFMSSNYVTTQQAMDIVSMQADKLNPAAASDVGFWGRLKERISKLPDAKGQFDVIKQAADRVTQHVVDLIVIFLLQTLIIPVLLLWGLYAVLRGLFASLAWPRGATGPVVASGASR